MSEKIHIIIKGNPKSGKSTLFIELQKLLEQTLKLNIDPISSQLYEMDKREAVTQAFGLEALKDKDIKLIEVHPTKREKKVKKQNMERFPKKYTIDEVLKHVQFTSKKEGRRKKVDFDGHFINMASQRYQNFALHGIICVKCGLKGTQFYLERHPTNEIWHFNLYADLPNGGERLMTKDHILARANGGKDVVKNYQPMCIVCNLKKGHKLEK